MLGKNTGNGKSCQLGIMSFLPGKKRLVSINITVKRITEGQEELLGYAPACF
jgi:hypothetical protein